jgi:hypothetical protein
MPKKSLMKLSLGEEARRKKKNKKASKTVLKRILPRGESYKVSILKPLSVLIPAAATE